MTARSLLPGPTTALVLAALLPLAAVAGCQRDGARQAAEPDRSVQGAGQSTGGRAAASTLPPSATPTSPPTATPTPHPLSIAWLRARRYPSQLTIEETLSPAANYSRYLASYTSDGLKIYALLTVPQGEPPPGGWPVVIFNHGYIPPAQYRTTERYVAYVDAFARNGYLVLKSDYRGHGNSEGQARGGYGRPDYTVDVLHALSAVRRFPAANPDRIGMWGHSMGGYITLRSMVATDTIKAGVIWAGVVASYPDLLARWHRRGGTTRHATPWPGRRWRSDLRREFGAPEQNPDFWNSISATSYLSDLSGPIQLHHGTADTSVPVAFSQTLYQQLQAAGVPAELYLYEGDDHNLSHSLSQALDRSVAFFDTHLKQPR